MRSPTTSHGQSRERGGITILVVLMLLILLTISALGLSRNSIRSAIATGTMGMAHQAANTSDAGAEFAIYWLCPDPNAPSLRAAPSGGALAFTQAKQLLEAEGPGNSSGYFTSTDFTTGTANGTTQSYDLNLSLLSKTTPILTSGNLKEINIYTWSIVSEGNVAMANGPTVTRRREVWVRLPPD